MSILTSRETTTPGTGADPVGTDALVRLATAVSVGPFLMLSTWTFLILARFGSGM